MGEALQRRPVCSVMNDARDSEVVSFILKTSVVCAECEYSNPVTCKES